MHMPVYWTIKCYTGGVFGLLVHKRTQDESDKTPPTAASRDKRSSRIWALPSLYGWATNERRGATSALTTTHSVHDKCSRRLQNLQFWKWDNFSLTEINLCMTSSSHLFSILTLEFVVVLLTDLLPMSFYYFTLEIKVITVNKWTEKNQGGFRKWVSFGIFWKISGFWLQVKDLTA